MAGIPRRLQSLTERRLSNAHHRSPLRSVNARVCSYERRISDSRLILTTRSPRAELISIKRKNHNDLRATANHPQIQGRIINRTLSSRKESEIGDPIEDCQQGATINKIRSGRVFATLPNLIRVPRICYNRTV